MEDRRTMSLALQPGESRQLLLEAGCTVLVLEGKLRLRSPAAWLAEQVLIAERTVVAESAWCAEVDGWLEMSALEASRLVVLGADSLSLWRQVGRCLEALFCRPSSRSAGTHG